MTTAPTDTGKRLSDVELAAIIARHNLSAPYHGHTPAEIDYNTGREERRALLTHIAALTAPPSQGKVERAREIWRSAFKQHFPSGGQDPTIWGAKPAIIAAITQALTEDSGQMGPEAAAILRTLGCVPDSTDLSETDAKISVGFLRRLIESSGQGTDGAEEQS